MKRASISRRCRCLFQSISQRLHSCNVPCLCECLCVSALQSNRGRVLFSKDRNEIRKKKNCISFICCFAVSFVGGIPFKFADVRSAHTIVISFGTAFKRKSNWWPIQFNILIM